MLYTTYFAKLKSLPETILPISICGKAPQGWKGVQYKQLAPRYDFFMKWKQDHDNDYYIKCYNEQVLGQLNPHNTMADFYSMADLAGKSGVALVCYEKSQDFCHRHLVADWLTNNGYECTEFEEER